eukprot:2662416-Prymnesium_polylepis.1
MRTSGAFRYLGAPNCSKTACAIKVEPADPSAAFRLVSYNLTSTWPQTTPLLEAKYAASKFLTQATFGPVARDVQQLSAMLLTHDSAAFSSWIDDQLGATPTLHRAYFRKRASPRGDMATTLDTFSVACRANSMWHRFALTQKDIGATIAVKMMNGMNGMMNGMMVIDVAGSLRTEVPDPTMFDPHGALGVRNT